MRAKIVAPYVVVIGLHRPRACVWFAFEVLERQSAILAGDKQH